LRRWNTGDDVRREKYVDGLGSSQRGGLDRGEEEEDIVSGRSGSESEVVVGERVFSSRSMEFGDGDRGMVLFY
jgi:hypothetical protein